MRICDLGSEQMRREYYRGVGIYRLGIRSCGFGRCQDAYLSFCFSLSAHLRSPSAPLKFCPVVTGYITDSIFAQGSTVVSAPTCRTQLEQSLCEAVLPWLCVATMVGVASRNEDVGWVLHDDNANGKWVNMALHFLACFGARVIYCTRLL